MRIRTFGPTQNVPLLDRISLISLVWLRQGLVGCYSDASSLLHQYFLIHYPRGPCLDKNHLARFSLNLCQRQTSKECIICFYDASPSRTTILSSCRRIHRPWFLDPALQISFRRIYITALTVSSNSRRQLSYQHTLYKCTSDGVQVSSQVLAIATC